MKPKKNTRMEQFQLFSNLDQEYNLPVYPKIFALMIGYPILIKAFLVLRLEIHFLKKGGKK